MREASADPREEIVGVRAVVVREGDDVGGEVGQGGIPRAREAAFRAKPDDLDPGMGLEDGGEPIVVVLIDDEEAKRSVRLPLERLEQPSGLVHTIDRGENEVERGQPRLCHRGEAIVRSRARPPDLMPDRPLVSVVLAAHDAERFVLGAVESVLGQTLRDVELIVVDDGSSDGTPQALASVRDPRLAVLRNERRRGLAASLNLGLERARGRFVARLDADDVALPERLERQVERLLAGGVGIVGSAVLDMDDAGRPGALHEMPLDPVSVRWHALFSSPFYHPTVLFDRALVDRLGLRYDERYEESEDYELWARLLEATDGANLAEPLVLYRVHAGQATQRRRGLQRDFQREVATRGITDVAPDLGAEEVELAWLLGAGENVAGDRLEEAAGAYLDLLSAFRRIHGEAATVAVVRSAARRVARAAGSASGAARGRLLRLALELDPALPARLAGRAAERHDRRRRALRNARPLLDGAAGAAGPGVPATVRVTVVAPEPTPYRAPVFDLLAARPEVDLTVVYSGRSLMWRSWQVELGHRAVFLEGVRIPGARRLVHHEFPVTPGIFAALARAQPDVAVVVGWSTFASQSAIAWCRVRGVPYVLEADSHDEGPRAGWRRAVKRSVVPRLVGGAASVLVTGTLVRRSMLAYGAAPERIRLFPVTVDAAAFGEQADRLRGRREELRRGLGIGPDDVAVLSVARLSPEKGLDTLVRAAAAAADPRLVVMVAGSGPEQLRLQELARSLRIRLLLLGERPWERMVEVYASAEVFCLLSLREPWGVVVNEAAACGLPLVLSDRVGAAADLLRDGENGGLVPSGDVSATAAALRHFASSASVRSAAGARSRELMRDWGYGPGVERFVEAVREAATSR